MTIMGKPLQIKKLKEFVKKKSLEADTIDFEAEVDETLTYHENKTHILEILNLEEDLSKKQIEAQIEVTEKQNIIDCESHEEQETQKALDLIKNANTEFLLPQLQDLHESVIMVTKGHFNGLICVGSGGLGKSFTIVKALAKSSVDYEVINTHITPLALYGFLFNNKDKVIVIEDAEQIMENTICLSLLRSATWGTLKDSRGEQIRTLTYYSTSKEASHLPQKFIFGGKIILVFNSVPQGNEIDALFSRLLVHKMDISVTDIKKAFIGLAKIPYKDIDEQDRLNIADKVCDFINAAHKNLNLRILIKCFEFFRFNKSNWFEKFVASLEIDEELLFIVELLKSDKNTQTQIEEFVEKTGKSRATYFRLKKKYLKQLGGSKL